MHTLAPFFHPKKEYVVREAIFFGKSWLVQIPIIPIYSAGHAVLYIELDSPLACLPNPNARVRKAINFRSFQSKTFARNKLL